MNVLSKTIKLENKEENLSLTIDEFLKDVEK